MCDAEIRYLRYHSQRKAARAVRARIERGDGSLQALNPTPSLLSLCLDALLYIFRLRKGRVQHERTWSGCRERDRWMGTSSSVDN